MKSVKYFGIAFSFVCFTVNAIPQSHETNLQIQEVAEKQLLFDKINEQFTFHAKFKSTFLDSNGKPLKQITEQDLDVIPDHGGYIMRRLSVNGKPLRAEFASKENNQVHSVIQDRESKKDISRRMPLVSDVILLSQITRVETSANGNNDIVIFKYKPRSGVFSANRNARLIAASEGEIHVDAMSAQIIKFQGKLVRAMLSDPESPTNLPVGSTFKFENTPLKDGVWVPQKDTICTPVGSIFNRRFIERVTVFSDCQKFEISGEKIERLPQ
ncbi:MAG: hypothetical protein HY014_10960 [Acidobacteria bacterium]|nr:hypothetical protein [Acidobacteriota bacterium]MBI3488674.1 hypothetical protein [Acidobacteriota bacterium]